MLSITIKGNFEFLRFIIFPETQTLTMSNDTESHDNSSDSSDDMFIDKPAVAKRESTWIKVKCDDAERAELLTTLRRSNFHHKTLDKNAMALLTRDAKVFRDTQERRRQQRLNPESLEKRKKYFEDPKVQERRKAYSQREDVRKRRLEQAKKKRQMLNELIKADPARALSFAEKFGVKILPRTYTNGHNTSKPQSKEPRESKSSKEKKEGGDGGKTKTK